MSFSLLPPDLDPLIALALIGLSLVTSGVTATFGVGGGSLLIAAIALVIPPAAAIPVHGLVQLGSNAGRAVIMQRFVAWRFGLAFLVGSIPGSFLGAQVALWLPQQLLSLAIAGFILWSAWAPMPEARAGTPLLTALAGLITSIVGMITGIGGPLVAAFLRFLPDRRQIIATHAVLMTAQNVLKALAFASLGFAFAPYLPLAAGMILSGLVGTGIGARLLSSLPEPAFRIGFKLLLTVAALGLLQAAVF
ncbi:MAG TPA: sulfite exporter TauE/SafE family protein [Alphaproteobacteria bacterium]|nr:sulfite exporter TauE/SafE family protein [Alphaproteobacteria bacterium]